MGERWKIQIKSGIFLALWMAFIMSLDFKLIDLKYLSSEKVLLFLKHFAVKFLFWLPPAILILGYFNWKQKTKKENNQ